MRVEDEEGNIYVLVPALEYKKGDHTCKGCVVREVSMVPGGKFCRSFEFKCQIPFNKQVWQQVKWGNYPHEPERNISHVR